MVNKKLTYCLKRPFFLYKMVDKGEGGGGMAQNMLTSTVNGPLLRTFVFIQNEYKVSMITYTGNTIVKPCNVSNVWL